MAASYSIVQVDDDNWLVTKSVIKRDEKTKKFKNIVSKKGYFPKLSQAGRRVFELAQKENHPEIDIIEEGMKNFGKEQDIAVEAIKNASIAKSRSLKGEKNADQ